MPAPFEAVNGPVTVFYAAVGTAVTPADIDHDNPGNGWTKLGTNGDKSYGEDGVTVTPSRSYEHQMVLGSTAPQKAYLTEQGFAVSVPLVDLTAETLARAMNNASITDTAPGNGTAGHRSFDLMMETEVAELAIVIQGKSSYLDSANAWHWIPRCYISDVGEYGFVKGDGATYEVEFTALEHETHGFGKYYVQDAAPN